MLRRWRRIDEPGLELFHLEPVREGFQATSSLIHAGLAPYSLRYQWTLDMEWRTQNLHLDLHSPEKRSMVIHRDGDASWRIDGRARPDLNGCEEVDLSATPFCNTLAIRRMAGATGELTVAYLAVPDLCVTPSLQRYEAVSDTRWRYVDLGVAEGFTAFVDVDDEGLVLHYEELFETLPGRQTRI